MILPKGRMGVGLLHGASDCLTDGLERSDLDPYSPSPGAGCCAWLLEVQG